MGPKSQSHPTDHSLPLFFSFLLHFSFFLSSSLSVLLQSKKLTHRPLTCTAFFLLSSDSMFFLFCSSPTGHSHTDPRPPKPRDHRCRSSITRRKAPPRTCSPHHCYRARSSIWPKHRNRHPQQQRISVGKDSIWKLYCRCREQLHWKLVFDLEAQFYFFMFFISWCIINKYEWSFEFGVMTCFRWC